MELLSVALVGCTGTGKTSLAQSASAGRDFQLEAAAVSRAGPTLSSRRHQALLGTGMRVDLWEAPTWELTLDPETHFARGCDGVIFVMDCTRRQTVDEVLAHWLHVARYHCSAEAPFLFIGAKGDLASEEAEALKFRLHKLELPALVGSCLLPSFAVEALEELLQLHQHMGGRPKTPLLAPLPPLKLPQALCVPQAVPTAAAEAAGPHSQSQYLSPTALTMSSPSFPGAGTAHQAPRTLRTKVAAAVPKWQIPAGELTFFERLDSEPERGGRSPAVYASWKGMPVVAKRVGHGLLLARAKQDKDRLQRLLSELHSNCCPHLAKFYGACLAEDPVSLVMEYMPGGDLERYLRSKRSENHRPWIPPRELVFSWAISCSSAMAYLAQLRPSVAHGNIRPSNLLLCTSLALRLSPCGALSPVEHRHQADVGAESLESCLYSPPEVLRKEAAEEQVIAADVFALGLVLWMMCTGARPLQHLDNDGLHKPPEHVMKAFKNGQVPRPRLADVSQGRQMQQLISKAWSDEPEERPSPAEIVEELKKMQAALDHSQCCCGM